MGRSAQELEQDCKCCVGNCCRCAAFQAPGSNCNRNNARSAKYIRDIVYHFQRRECAHLRRMAVVSRGRAAIDAKYHGHQRRSREHPLASPELHKELLNYGYDGKRGGDTHGALPVADLFLARDRSALYRTKRISWLRSRTRHRIAVWRPIRALSGLQFSIFHLPRKPMPDPTIRARVVRLISGDVRSDDIARLFLYARDRCDGREAVQEIGDFVAHHTERVKGIVTRSTREWFATARFFTETMKSGANAANLPPITKEFLLANVQRLELKHLRQTGLNRTAAIKATDALANRLIKSPDGSYAVPASLSDRERALFNALATVMVVKPAFTGKQLSDAFFATLKSNGVITNAEVAGASFLIDAVQLFAVANIHASEIVMSDGTKIKLSVGAKEQHIGIHAAVPVTHPRPMGIFMASEIFTTDLDRVQHSAPELAARESWDGAVELGPDRKLHFLG